MKDHHSIYEKKQDESNNMKKVKQRTLKKERGMKWDIMITTKQMGGVHQ